MSTTQHAFAEAQYAPRANDYVTSINHSTGADLEQVAALVAGHAASGKATARVLDLGCGGGHLSYAAAPHAAEVVACDITADMLAAVTATAAARGLGNISVQQAPAEHLPFGDGSFDIVLCRFSTHHWQDMEAGLRQARRVLKPTGFAVFIDVISPANPTLDTHLQTVELLRDPSHVRDYTLAEWAGALARSGFATVSLTPRRLDMDFPVWTARTRTPPLNADAVRAVQTVAPPVVQQHFAVTDNGSFTIDTMTMVVLPV